MEMLYSIHSRSECTNRMRFETRLDNKGHIKVSSRNLVAFTTANEIESGGANKWGFHVYVADINTPWYSYKIVSNTCPITALEWDVLGKHLLVCDISGNCQIWSQKDSLVSEWHQLYECHFAGEHIVQAAFFHNGIKMSLPADKKDVTNYIDKFQRVNFTPSVVNFGGVPAEGVFVVTITGMIGAFLIPADHQQSNNVNATNSVVVTQIHSTVVLPSTTASLGPSRIFIDTADISHDKDGHFLVAVTNGQSDNIFSQLVNCYRVLVKRKNDKLSITSRALPSFFLCDDLPTNIDDLKVTHLKWIGNSLLVGSRHLSGCFLDMWKLTEKTTHIHRQFQPQNQTEMFKNDLWVKQYNFKHNSTIVDICSPKIQYGNTSYLFVSMLDNTIHCLHTETLNRALPSTSLTVTPRNEHDQPPSAKFARIETHIGGHAISHMGHLMMVIDTHGTLCAYKIVYPHQDTSGNVMTTLYLVSLLEYCLVSGIDALDIFLHVKPALLDGVVDRLTENFTRQAPPVQQYYYVNFLTMKTNLYRLSISGQLRAHDLTSLLMLHSILIAFKSLLRPSDLTNHDKGPAENLAMVLSESVTDIDKVVLGLRAKDFTVEKSTLQSLQQLMQWVADLALNILAKLPESRSSRNVGYDISKDIVALNSIRELLVMMRIWGLLKPQSLPVFSQSDENLDILLQAFKLLTRLTFNPNEPDDILLDECCLLPSQVLIPQLQFIPTQTSVTSPLLSYINLPVKFEYNTEPVCLKFIPEIPVVEGGLCNDSMVDSVRHLQLGKRPPSLRRCTRCGACSSITSLAKTAAMRAWEQRWSNGCRCGGFWRLQIMD